MKPAHLGGMAFSNLLLVTSLSLLIVPLISGGLLAEEKQSDLAEKAALLKLERKGSPYLPLDSPIDPANYRLGPGDALTIFIWGNVQAQYELTVTPEGNLLLPTIGPVSVAGLNLSEAKRLLESELLKRYRNVQVVTDLTGLREFRVYIGGAVKSPGVFAANAITRVSEIIGLAGGFIGEDSPAGLMSGEQYRNQPPPGVAAHRNILVTHLDGRTDTADVLRFEIFGDLKYNFTLNDGDRIFIPLREKAINLYGIFGGVRNPGFYEYSPRDSLKDLIMLGHGLSLDADSTSAEIVRFNSDARTTSSIRVPLRRILDGESPDLHLKPDDRVFIGIRRDYHEKQMVLIMGQVKNPGFYPVVPESTSLSQVIGLAGGFTELASLAEAEMTRFTSEETKDREFERLKSMKVEDMSELEYEYFKMKSREKPGRVSVNFVELFQSGQGDIKLRDGDFILIPKVSEVVKVSGEVANPGLLSYSPERNYLDYIKLAGGYSFRAQKSQVKIIKGVTGEWQKASKKNKLNPGDTILVPEKKKVNYIGTIKDVLVFAGNLATVYLVVKEATK